MRQSPRPAAALLRDFLAPLAGARIAGGCEHCDAYQTVHPVVDGVWSIAVCHDDWCPWFRQHERQLR